MFNFDAVDRPVDDFSWLAGKPSEIESIPID